MSTPVSKFKPVNTPISIPNESVKDIADRVINHTTPGLTLKDQFKNASKDEIMFYLLQSIKHSDNLSKQIYRFQIAVIILIIAVLILLITFH